ncbi:MAG: MFS transporter [Motilibacteraceae bacterium]
MLRPYRAVLAHPGAMAFSGVGVLARLPISMLGIGIVLLLSAERGSYGLAGAVSAVFMAVSSVAAPVIAGLVDRHGQGRVLRPVVVTNAVALTALVVLTEAHAAVWTLVLAAAAAGAAMPSVGSMVRARWRAVLGDAELHTAFSLESVLDEVIFVVGPVLATVLATQVSPPAGVVAGLVAGLCGGLLLSTLRRTEPAVHATAHVRGRPVLAVPAVAVLALAFVFVGALFGSCDVAVVAFASEHGVRPWAGALIACMAGGSMLAGLWFGTRSHRSPAATRARVGVVLLAIGVLPFAAIRSVPLLAVGMFVAGLAISPMIISGFAVIEEVAPAGRLTEGLTWATTALGLGTAAAAAVAGHAADAGGSARAFLVTAACGVLAAVVVLAGGRALGRGARTARPAGEPATDPTGAATTAPAGS